MLFKYSGKYVNIYFNMKITYPLMRGLRASSGRGLCLLRSVDSLYTERLGVPGLPGPHGSQHSCRVAMRFPLCGCPLFSLAEEMAHWRYPPF